MQGESNWRANLIDDDAGIREILQQAKRIAVIGAKNQPGAAAYYVPNLLYQEGYEMIPVNPSIDRAFGMDAYDSLADVPGEIDIVQVFRRPEFVRGHAEEALLKRPRVFWTQTGIVDLDSAELLARAGIKVVMDRCMMVDHQRLLGYRS